jgi:hypothetical protein
MTTISQNYSLQSVDKWQFKRPCAEVNIDGDTYYYVVEKGFSLLSPIMQDLGEPELATITRTIERGVKLYTLNFREDIDCEVRISDDPLLNAFTSGKPIPHNSRNLQAQGMSLWNDVHFKGLGYDADRCNGPYSLTGLYMSRVPAMKGSILSLMSGSGDNDREVVKSFDTYSGCTHELHLTDIHDGLDVVTAVQCHSQCEIMLMCRPQPSDLPTVSAAYYGIRDYIWRAAPGSFIVYMGAFELTDAYPGIKAQLLNNPHLEVISNNLVGTTGSYGRDNVSSEDADFLYCVIARVLKGAHPPEGLKNYDAWLDKVRTVKHIPRPELAVFKTHEEE